MALDNCKLIGSGGLANKVEVSLTSGVQNVGDQTLFIIPNEGFTVAAEDFSVFNVTYGANGNSLVYNPTGDIDVITLSNTTTAHSLDNKVKVVVNLVNSFSINSNTVIPIDLDGKGIEINPTINVIPHVLNQIYSNNQFSSITITKQTDNPPVINNTDKKTHAHTIVPYDITYLPCTIQPNTSTKIATIVVTTASNAGGHFSMVNPPYLTSLSPADYAHERYELVQTSQVISGSSAITSRTFDLYYQDSEDNNFVGTIWPSSYDSVGASAGQYNAVVLVAPRPLFVQNPVSTTDNTIDVISMHDTPILEAEPIIPDKVIEDGLDATETIFNVGNLNPHPVLPEIGTIVKATEDEPNTVSIQGTPGTTFNFSLLEDGVTKSDLAGLPTGTQTIPESGIYKANMTTIPTNTGTSGKVFDLTINALGTSTISTTAGRPQQQKPGTSITEGEANNIVLRYKQPSTNTSIRLTGSAGGNIAASSDPLSGTADPLDSSKCLGASITGIGGTLVDAQSNAKYNFDGSEKGVQEVVNFTMTRQGTGSYSNSQAVISGTILFHKFGDTSVDFDINFSLIFSRGSTQFTLNKAAPAGLITSGLSTTNPQAQVLGDFTISANSTGVEAEITNLTATVINTNTGSP